MKTLDRYVSAAFLQSFALLLVVGLGSYVLLDLLINLDEFTENRALSVGDVLWVMVDYYGYNLPVYFSQLCGPLMAFAASYTLALMLRNREMVALLAAGVPLQRVAVPIFVCSIGIVGLWMANREIVLPNIAHKTARAHDDLTGQRNEGIWLARDDNDAMLTARRIRLRENQLDFVKIIEPGEDQGLVEADAAIYDPQRHMWKLIRGERIHEGRNAAGEPTGIISEPITEYPFTLTPEELLLRQSSQWAGSLGLSQMNALLRSSNLPNLAAIRMQRHIWLTQPLLQWLLLTLSLPFFLTREPVSVLAAGGKALLVAIAFFAVTFLAHSVVSVQWAALLAWVPILIFGPIGVLLLANVKT